MDLRAYYRKIRALEASIETADAVVVSQETPDGGKAGMMTEVPRLLAARLVVEEKARLATEEEASRFAADMKEAKRISDERVANSQVRVALISDADMRRLKGGKEDSRTSRGRGISRE